MALKNFLGIKYKEIMLEYMGNILLYAHGDEAIMKSKEIDNNVIPANLYVLKHKDLDVAMVQVDLTSGKIEYVLAVYLPEELPVGYSNDGIDIIDWWKSRAIPDSRRGIQQVLNYLNEGSNLSLMLSAYGLSLTDHYWMQPIGESLYWGDLNFFENEFSDELGSLLTDSKKVNLDENISKFSPSSSVIGEMKKKWVIKDGVRYLMKVNANDYGQQSVNELIASRLHQRLGWSNYVPYEIETARVDEKEVPCSLNRLFTSTELELVSAYQLVKNYKIPNDISNYEAVIQQAVLHGMNENEVRGHLEYMILTDFILTNTDRHFNNFGFLYNSRQHKLVAMAPIYDTGNSLFYNKEFIPRDEYLLDITVTSFKKREVDMLQFVSNKELVNCGKLDGYAEEVETMLKKYTAMPEGRAEHIAWSVKQKIEYLQLFQQGKKIWKKEKYW